MLELWIKKYEPKSLSDIAGNKEVIEILKKFAEKKIRPPNLLLYGPPGSGKTTIVKCFLREYLGENWLEKTRIILGSFERSIGNIRSLFEEISGAQYGEISPIGVEEGQKLKKEVLFIDTIDMLTNEAQKALRHVMDLFPNVTFIATADSITSISPPLLSRFLLLRLSRPSTDSIIAFVSKIMMSEGISINHEVLKYIVEALDNDIRRIISFLQFIHASGRTLGSIDEAKELLGYNLKEIRELLELILSNNIGGAIKKSKELLNNGYAAYDILSLLFEIIQRETKEFIPEYIPPLSKLISKYIQMSIQGVPDNILMYSFIIESTEAIKHG